MDELEARLETLERAVTEDEHDLSALATDGDAVRRLGSLEERTETLTDRVDELEAATQALRGYVGNVRSVNRDVEQRTEAALAKVESLETTVRADASDDRIGGAPDATTSQRDPTAGDRPGGTEAGGSERDREQEPRRDRERRPESDGSVGRHHPHDRCQSCGRPAGSRSVPDGLQASGVAGSAGPQTAPSRRRDGADPFEAAFEPNTQTETDESTFDRIRKLL